MKEFEALVAIEAERRAAEKALKEAKAKLDLYAIQLEIESLKRKVERLKGEERAIQLAGSFILGEETVVCGGRLFYAKPSKPSANLKPGINVEDLPEELKRTSVQLNKEEALKLYKTQPWLLRDYVDIEAPTLMTYKLVKD